MRLISFSCHIMPSTRGVADELELRFKVVTDIDSPLPMTVSAMQHHIVSFIQGDDFVASFPLALDEMYDRLYKIIGEIREQREGKEKSK